MFYPDYLTKRWVDRCSVRQPVLPWVAVYGEVDAAFAACEEVADVPAHSQFRSGCIERFRPGEASEAAVGVAGAIEQAAGVGDDEKVGALC